MPRQVYYMEITDQYRKKSAQFETDKIPRTFEVQNSDKANIFVEY